MSLFVYMLYLVPAGTVVHDRNILYNRFFFLNAFFIALFTHGLLAQLSSAFIVPFTGQCLFNRS